MSNSRERFIVSEDTYIRIDGTYVNLKDTEFTILALLEDGEYNLIDIEFTTRGMMKLEENISEDLFATLKYVLEETATIEKKYEQEAYETIKRLITKD